MKNKQMLFAIIFSLITTASCSSDEEEEGCRESGVLSATWSDGQALKFNYNVFTEEQGGIGVQSVSDAEFCAPRVSISITDVATIVGRQELIRYNRDGNFVDGSIWVRTMDTDALTEVYLLDTLQPRWIDIDEVSTNRINGVINATFALEESTVNKAWNFPDTLRFNQERFELVIRE